MDYKDIFIRLIKTFFQAFLGTLIAGLSTGFVPENWKAVLYSLFVASVAAGFSAVGNFILQYLQKEDNTNVTEETNA